MIDKKPSASTRNNELRPLAVEASCRGRVFRLRLRPGTPVSAALALSLWMLGVPFSHAQDDLRHIPDPDPLLQLEMLHPAEGFEVNLFAAEPMVAKPIQMNWDAEGRLWVVSSTVYPQVRPGEQPNDKIYVLEDTNGDGQADKSTVFADGLLTPTGIAPGDGGVYVANSTEILHLKDTTGDGKADQRQVVLSGFGTADTHHLIHTFRWGPDGMLYFNQSIYIFSHIETPWGVRRLRGGGVWQLRPETLELEVYARGLVNPWGLQFDGWGQSFLTDGAGGQGINYAFPGATFTAAPEAERILEGLSPGQPKHSGLEILSGRHLPESWHGHMITNDYRANRINRFALSEQGSGYAAEQLDDLLWTDHVAFRPVDVTVGPDGAIYVADWYNPIIQHGEVDFRDPRRDQERGRIWRITASDRPVVDPPDLVNAAVPDLLEALKLPENWTRAQARQILKEFGPDDVVPALEVWVEELDPSHSDYEHHLLEALWVCQALDFVNERLLNQLLEAEDHRARSAALRLLYYWHDRVEHVSSILERAVADDHAQVRLEAVVALRLQENAEAARQALSVLDHTTDDFLDFALWQTARHLEPFWMPRLEDDLYFLGDYEKTAYALSAVSSSEAARHLVERYDNDRIPEEYHDAVLTSVARWGRSEELNIIFQRVLTGEDITDDRRAAYLNALEEAANHQGIRPDGHLEAVGGFLDHDNQAIRASAIRLIGHWDLTEYRSRVAALAERSPDEQVRMASLDALAAIGDEESRQLLRALTARDHSSDVRQAAVARLASLDIAEAATLAVEVLRSLPEDADPSELYSSFLSRTEGTRTLAEELSEQNIPEEMARAGRQAMQRELPWYRRDDHDSRALIEALEASGGTLPPERMPQELSALEINNLEREVRTTADPVRGEEIYHQPALMCTNCHAIGGAGGLSGPDLSSLGASAPTDYIIRAILEPNTSVKEGYELTRVVRHDGSIVMGTLIRQTSSEVVLRNAADQEVTIPASQVEVQEVASGSLMPPGLTARLEREEFIDLIGFLSRLGEPGEYRVPTAQLVRRWRALSASESNANALRENGIEFAADENNPLTWLPVYSNVSGALNIQDLPEITLNSDQKYSVAWFELEVTSAGNIGLTLPPGPGLSVWVNQEQFTNPGGVLTIPLAEGTHRFTVTVDRTAYNDPFLSIELTDVDVSPAHVRPVAGK